MKFDIEYVQKKEPRVGLVGRAKNFFEAFHPMFKIDYIAESILEVDNQAYIGSCFVKVKAPKCWNSYNIDLIKVDYSIEDQNYKLCLGLHYGQGGHVGLGRGNHKSYILVTAKDITASSSTGNPCNLI